MNEEEREEAMPNVENNPKSIRPVQEIRLGRVKAAIWANRTREGVIFNVTFVPIDVLPPAVPHGGLLPLMHSLETCRY